MASEIGICVFGSHARGTSDALSDQDVLIVGQPSTHLNQAVEHWTSRNWNVSVFSRPAFERMANVKSLFVQHVKQEGRIVCDPSSFLVSVLKEYEPKADYSPERNDALKQIGALPPIRGSGWFDLCLADILYVLFRNAAILHLANKNEYCFHYRTLTVRMAEIFDLNSEEETSLVALRDLKHAYRRRQEGSQIAKTIIDIFTIVEKITSKLSDVRLSSIASGVTTSDYFHLRLRELELVSQFSPSQLDSLSAEHPLYAIWQEILQPDPYRPKPASH